MDTSIIIVNWNGLRHLPKCLSSLFNQTYQDFSVIMVDNGSTDDSLNFVQENYPQVEIIANQKNLGFAQANNLGIKKALANPKTKYAVLLNNDTEVKADWLEQLIKTAEEKKDAGLVTSKILYFDRRDIIDSTGDYYYQGSLKIVPRGHGQKDSGQYDQAEECLAACAASALYKREVLEQAEINGDFLDNDFFAYIEDQDLSLRARLLGWRCFYQPSSVIYHKVSATTTKLATNQKKYLSLRNRILTAIKIYPLKFWPQVFKNPITFAGPRRSFWTNLCLYAKIFCQILWLLPKFMGKRKKIREKTKVPFEQINEWVDQFSVTYD